MQGSALRYTCAMCADSASHAVKHIKRLSRAEHRSASREEDKPGAVEGLFVQVANKNGSIELRENQQVKNGRLVLAK